MPNPAAALGAWRLGGIRFGRPSLDRSDDRSPAATDVDESPGLEERHGALSRRRRNTELDTELLAGRKPIPRADRAGIDPAQQLDAARS
jgi:hypothetical protein